MKAMSENSTHLLPAKFLKVFFILHLVGLILYTVLNYVDLNKGQLEVTARGRVNLFEHNWKPVHPQVRDSANTQVTVLVNKMAFARIDYSRFNPLMQSSALFYVLTDILYAWLWLLLTYYVYQIAVSLKNSEMFGNRSCSYLNKIALIVGLEGLLSFIIDEWFALILKKQISFDGYTIGVNEFPGIWHFLPYFAVMLLLMLLAKIFKFGNALKQEIDLTV